MRLAWMMRIEQWNPADEAAARACHDVMLAVHQADGPVELTPIQRQFFAAGRPAPHHFNHRVYGHRHQLGNH